MCSLCQSVYVIRKTKQNKTTSHCNGKLEKDSSAHSRILLIPKQNVYRNSLKESVSVCLFIENNNKIK